MRRWPKPGARTATASIVRCWLLETSMPSAGPSTFSASTTSGRWAFMTRSSAGRRSWGWEIGLFVMRIIGSSKTVSMRCLSCAM